jgi:hypothetical protein
MERKGACEAGRLGAGLGGRSTDAAGGGVGADAGGGGGGAAGEARPNALRAACSAREGAWPFVGAFDGGGGAGAAGGREELS